MTEDQNQDFAKLAAASEAHTKLAPFIGTFRSEVKMWMGPGEPHISTGTMVNDLDLGGRFLRQTYRGDDEDGPFSSFEGRGYWGFNNITQRYEGFWIDTASTMMQHETGELDETGRFWTMIGQAVNPKTGENMVKKSVITLVDDDHHRMEMFIETAAGEVKGMEISYVRAE